MGDMYEEIVFQILKHVDCTLLAEACSLCLVSRQWRKLMHKIPSKFPFLLGSNPIETFYRVFSYVWTNEFILNVPLIHDCRITSVKTVLKCGTVTDRSKYGIGIFEPARLIEMNKYQCNMVCKQNIPIILPEDELRENSTQTIIVDPPLNAKKGQLVGLLYETNLPFEDDHLFPRWPCHQGDTLQVFIDNVDGFLSGQTVGTISWNVTCEATFPETDF